MTISIKIKLTNHLSVCLTVRQMDGWMDGRTDGQTDGRTDEWMDGWIERLHM